MTFDDAINYLQNAPFTGGSGDRFAISISLIAIQGGGVTLSLSATMNILTPSSARELQTAIALSTSGSSEAYLSSRVSTVIVPPNYDPGETFEQPFYAGDLENGTPAMEVTISRPTITIAALKPYFVTDFPAFSDSSDTGLVASFEVKPLQDFYRGLRQFSIRLHDLGAGYAGAGPAVDGSKGSAFYAMNLRGELIPG